MKYIFLNTLIFTIMSTATFAQITQPALPYAYNALEPYIDAATMEIHYSRHHAAYVTNLNNALPGSALEGKSLDQIIAATDASTPAAIRNNGGGTWNHTFFWNIMGPNAGGQPGGDLAKAIEAKWGSFDNFKAEFKKAALGQFGSGWAWLIVSNGQLAISATPNQDNPLMPVAAVKGQPVLGIDVWEHAYYLKYQNKRADYVDNFWGVVNWPAVEKLYKAAL